MIFSVVRAENIPTPLLIDLKPPTDSSKITVIPPYSGSDKRPEPIPMTVSGTGQDAISIPPISSEKFIKSPSLEEQQKTKDSLTNSPFFSNVASPKDTVACFDYYHFNSLQVDAAPTLNAVVSGTPINFSGKIINNNNYPVVEGSVYAKMFRRQNDEKNWRQNAHDIVDQFFVADNVNIGANGYQPIDFTWQIPSSTVTGDYFISFYFVSGKQFNLLGLSFLDDITGSMFPFHITGEQQGTIIFNKNSVTLNGKENHIAEPHLRFSKDEPIIAKIQVSNTTHEQTDVPIHWTLFNWDGLKIENQIDAKNETITLKAGETKELSYKIIDTKYPVYYLVVETDYKDSKSFLDIRFVREDVNKIRLNFPAVTSYPLEAGKSTTLFSCLHNSGTGAVVKNGKLDLTITDETGNIVDSYTYQGDVTKAMMGVKHDFVTTKTHSNFTVNAKLYQDDILVDEAHMKYNCKALGVTCPVLASVEKNDDKIESRTVIIFLILLLVLLLFGLRWLRKNKQVSLMIFGLFIVGGVLFGDTGIVQASQTKGASVGGSYHDTYDSDGNGGSYDISYVNGVTYYGSTNYSDGAVLHVGDVITFQYAVDTPWYFASGGGYDSPYGVWSSNFTSDYENYYGATGGEYWFGVNYPSVNVNQYGSAGLSCWGIGNGTACQVASVGTIVTQIHFNSTLWLMTWSNCWSQGNCISPRAWGGQDIWYSMSSVSNNNAPNAPNITEQWGNNHFIGQSQNFNFSASDPDGDKVAYLIDWNNDGSGDQWTGWVGSGGIASAPRTFATIGTKTIRAMTFDSKWANSGWSAPYSITIIAPTINVFSANPTTVPLSQSSTLTWTTSNVSACWASGAGDWEGWKTINTTATQSVRPTVIGITNYALECWNSVGVSSGKRFAPVTATCMDIWPVFNPTLYCPSYTTTQRSSCGNIRTVTGSGPGVWTPRSSNTCSSLTVTQTRCGNESRTILGTKDCTLPGWREIVPAN